MVWPVVFTTGYNARDDEVASSHTDSSTDKHWFAAKRVDIQNCWDYLFISIMYWG